MGKKAPASVAGQLDTGLKAEVQAFASGLGLASGVSNGFHDADFRPAAAKQPRNRSQPRSQVQDTKDHKAKGRESKAPTKQPNRHTASRSQQQSQNEQQNKPKSSKPMRVPGGGGQNQLPNVKERQWNEGAGTRPGMQFPMKP